ncbi:major facilitator superfamily domain-containing protein [Hygrophoropsis aurantiaca]|uniref:Major facilitator superfamily domain-containing protein n=1 Tax=Hygrophoropsis aurantiaca TaxID=72124 RepID=A0ACB8A383_9AGAM|nr:major facilitator superfamily domain-containing protein [Hygrophoropsis aurantiaca]
MGKTGIDMGSHPSMDSPSERGWRFWLIFISIASSLFLAALELASVATALPRIVDDLHGTQFVWVGSAYALAATAFVPLSGALAQAFGRRSVMLLALFLFTAGSAVCGAATSLNMLIAGRVIQGIGGGSIASVTQIILSDLVPLHKRGTYSGLIGISWGIASGIGPVVGGAFAESGNWRWLFYMNIPICLAIGAFVLIFLRLRTPDLTWREKFDRLDFVGNLLVAASTTSVVIALTWGGIQYPWSSPRVLVPLVLGIVGLFGFLAYESKYPKYPIVPFSLMSTATGLSGFLQTFILPIGVMASVYYVPVYFQACMSASPIASGVDRFGAVFTLAPAGIVAGASVTRSGGYRVQLWIAWSLVVVGMAMLSTLDADSSRAYAVAIQIIGGCGAGAISTTTYFPALAPLDVSQNAQALAFFAFLRNFAQVWGITIGGTILQNQLHARLPPTFTSQFPEGTAIAYSIIPIISTLEEPLKTQVRVAFAESLRVIWRVFIGIGGMGLLASLPMKALPLHTAVDKNWGFEHEEKDGLSRAEANQTEKSDS